MYTIRLAPTLFEPDPSGAVVETVAATTALGDWYVQSLRVGRREVLLCTSARSLLTIIAPATELDDLPEALAIRLVLALRSLGIAEDAIEREIDAMAEGLVDEAADPAIARALTALARRAEAVLTGRRWSAALVDEAHAALWAYRSRLIDGRSAASATREILAHLPA